MFQNNNINYRLFAFLSSRERKLKKLDKSLIALHEFHNFRESHVRHCVLCRRYYQLSDLLLKSIDNGKS